MKLLTPNCPKCGMIANGKLATTECIFFFRDPPDANNEVDFNGDFRDTGNVIVDVKGQFGNLMLMCDAGHKWEDGIDPHHLPRRKRGKRTNGDKEIQTK